VRIDVDQLLQEREAERNPTANQVAPSTSPKKEMPKRESARKNIVKDENTDGILPPPKAPSRKRKADAKVDSSKLKKIKISHLPTKLPSTISIPSKAAPKISVTLKLGPRPPEPEPFPCCLCVSMSQEGLLRVHEPPTTRKDAMDAAGSPKVWKAHEYCASIVPETWVDELDTHGVKEKVVFGVDGIVKDRWNLVCFMFFRLCSCIHSRINHRNAPLARRLSLKDTVPQFNVRRASVPRLSTSTALGRGMAWGLFLPLFVKLRKMSFFLTPLRGPLLSMLRVTQCKSILVPRRAEMLCQWIPPSLMDPLTLAFSRSSKSWKCRSCVHNITRYVELKLCGGFNGGLTN